MYPFASRMGGVDEALDDDVIDDGAAGVWCKGSGDELLTAVACVAFVFDEMVDDEEEDDGKICSALLPFSDAGPVWSSIMRPTPKCLILFCCQPRRFSGKRKREKIENFHHKNNFFFCWRRSKINIHTRTLQAIILAFVSLTRSPSTQKMDENICKWDVCVQKLSWKQFYPNTQFSNTKHQPRKHFVPLFSFPARADGFFGVFVNDNGIQQNASSAFESSGKHVERARR